MKTEKYILPAFWASALINGDFSGLSPAEEKTLLLFLYVNCPGDAVDCVECGFRWRHDASALHVGGADCAEFTFIKG